MRISKAVKHFGSAAALARELGLTHSVVYNWRDRANDPDEAVIPELWARRLHDKTGGKLRFDPRNYGLDS
jgi:hypothetical protein